MIPFFFVENSSLIKEPIFSPTGISNLALWLDVSNFSSLSFTSGNKITGWNDLSSNQYNFSTTSAPTYNATGFNNLPGIMFSGNQNMFNSAINVTQPNTVILIACQTGLFLNQAAAYASHSSTFSSTGGQFIFNQGGNIVSYAQGAVELTSSVPFSGHNFIVSIFNGINSILYTGITPIVSGNAGIANQSGIYLGQQSANSFYWNGPISEIIIYSGVLNQFQITQLYIYERNKWRIQ